MRYSILLFVISALTIILGCLMRDNAFFAHCIASDHSALIQVLTALYTTSSLWKGAGGFFLTSLERQMGVCSNKITNAFDEGELTDATIKSLKPIIEKCEKSAEHAYVNYEASARIWAILGCVALFLKAGAYPNICNVILFFPLAYIFLISFSIYFKGNKDIKRETEKAIAEYKSYKACADKIALAAQKKAADTENKSPKKSEEKLPSKMSIKP